MFCFSEADFIGSGSYDMQTMNRFPVSTSKDKALEERMRCLGIRASDLDEHFMRGTGAGGQKINKTSVCVVLRHKPTGVEVRCQRERSQAMNRFLARRELCERIEARLAEVKTERRQAAEKVRRQKRRRSRRQRARVLEDKRKHSEKKAGRRAVDW
jgi:protein subunit release factor B